MRFGRKSKLKALAFRPHDLVFRVAATRRHFRIGKVWQLEQQVVELGFGFRKLRIKPSNIGFDRFHVLDERGALFGVLFPSDKLRCTVAAALELVSGLQQIASLVIEPQRRLG